MPSAIPKQVWLRARDQWHARGFFQTRVAWLAPCQWHATWHAISCHAPIPTLSYLVAVGVPRLAPAHMLRVKFFCAWLSIPRWPLNDSHAKPILISRNQGWKSHKVLNARQLYAVSAHAHKVFMLQELVLAYLTAFLKCWSAPGPQSFAS